MLQWLSRWVSLELKFYFFYGCAKSKSEFYSWFNDRDAENNSCLIGNLFCQIYGYGRNEVECRFVSSIVHLCFERTIKKTLNSRKSLVGNLRKKIVGTSLFGFHKFLPQFRRVGCFVFRKHVTCCLENKILWASFCSCYSNICYFSVILSMSVCISLKYLNTWHHSVYNV
jgi:hypothetical protein